MMGNQSLFLIDQKEGLSLEFSKLLSMMDYTRVTTLAEVKDLSVEQLDYLINKKANSIGMLLAHLVSVEKAYQIDTFEKREFTEEDFQKLNPGLELGNAAREQIKGNTIEFYLEQLAQTRKRQLIHSGNCLIHGCLSKLRFGEEILQITTSSGSM